MRRYTNKELKNMSHEEREKLVNERLVEFEKLGQQIRDILANDNNFHSEKEKAK